MQVIIGHKGKMSYQYGGLEAHSSCPARRERRELPRN